MWAATIGIQALCWFIAVFVFRLLGLHKGFGTWGGKLRAWIRR
jgi:hypothetical protein